MKTNLNKRGMGGTLTNWIFIIGLVLLFVYILQSVVISPMNTIYSEDFETGLNTSSLADLQALKTSANSEVKGAEVTQTTDGGLSLKSAWTIGKSIYETIVSFVSGTFINNLVVDILDLPQEVANVLIVLIWLSLILIIIYIFMKVTP